MPRSGISFSIASLPMIIFLISVSLFFNPAEVLAADIVMHCRVSGGSDINPYDSQADAFNGVGQISEKIAEVNGGGSADYDLDAMGNRITVYLADGLYTNQMLISSSFITSENCNIIIQNLAGAAPFFNSSNAEHRIVVRADYTLFNGLSVAAPLPLEGTKRGFVIEDANHVALEHCTVQATWQGVWLTNANDCRIHHSEFHENECGINVSYGLDADIFNCSAHNNANIGMVIKGQIGGNASGTIRKCAIHSNLDGIWISTTHNTSWVVDCEISGYNEIYNNTQYGIRVWSTLADDTVIDNALVIKNNFIYALGSQRQDIGIYMDNSSNNARVVNNVIFGNDNAAIFLEYESDENYCANNIIWIENSANSYGIYCRNHPMLHFSQGSDYNCIYRPGSGYYGHMLFGGTLHIDLASLLAWQVNGGVDTNSMGFNPEFVDISHPDFHIKSMVGHWNDSTLSWDNDTINSPCVDAGDPMADYSLEPSYNGNRINQGGYGNTPYASKTDANKPVLVIDSPPAGQATVIGPAVNSSITFRVPNVDCDYFLRIGGDGTIGCDSDAVFLAADTSKNLPITPADLPDDADTIVYIIVRGLDGKTTTGFRVFHDDETPPATTLYTVISGSMPGPALIEGFANESVSDVDYVCVAVRDSDNNFYSPANAAFIPGPGEIWINVSNPPDWTLNTSDVPWILDTDYTISINASDTMGNIDVRDVADFTHSESVGMAGGGKGGGGCFLATACFECDAPDPCSRTVTNSTGTYQISPAYCGRLETLCVFRDGLLSKYRSGRAFIRFYYRTSPAVANAIRGRPVRKALVRWFIVTPAAVLARELLGYSYLLRTIAFMILLGALMHLRRRRSGSAARGAVSGKNA
ncbi:MAG: right-handed parallel beta-helix repeat-containing protein [Planctomycetota bacterium]|jgi:parallel beta-helix repeat protein